MRPVGGRRPGRGGLLTAAALIAAVTGVAACGPADPPASGAPAASPGAGGTETEPAESGVRDADAPRAPDGDAPRSPDTGAARVPDSVRAYRAPRQTDAVAEPTVVRIPVIGVESPLDRLEQNADGSVEVPSRYDRAGWYAKGARPGQPAAAVLLGHVDSRAGPAVFYRVSELVPGDEVLVDREDGSTATFVVDRVERHEKKSFPSEAVYFPTLERTLALVTCGGPFDTATRRYRDNVIVFASLRG